MAKKNENQSIKTKETSKGLMVTTFTAAQMKAIDSLEKSIRTQLDNVRKNSIIIGAKLVEINSKKYFLIGDYKNIQEYALDKFNFQKNMCYNLMDVATYFTDNGYLLPEYEKYDFNQLVEMVPLAKENEKNAKANEGKKPEEMKPIYDLSVITPEMTINEIRDTKKALKGEPVKRINQEPKGEIKISTEEIKLFLMEIKKPKEYEGSLYINGCVDRVMDFIKKYEAKVLDGKEEKAADMEKHNESIEKKVPTSGEVKPKTAKEKAKKKMTEEAALSEIGKIIGE